MPEKMRHSLEMLDIKIELIDSDNLYQAIAELKDCLRETLQWLDKALPQNVEPD